MSIKKIKPLGKRILVKRAEATATKGGILLPDSAQEKPKQGDVIATGPGARKEDGTLLPLDVKVGDRVLFGAFSGTEVKTGDEGEYLIMSEDDILVVVE